MSSEQQKGRFGFIAIDLIMMILLAINLLWISFDWLFQSTTFRELVYTIWPAFHDAYALHIHDDFIFYDLIFIGIFLTEFVVRWIIAIYSREYRKWYYYPFIYWYDLVGCIPIGAFRFVRLLRVVSILIRLHKLGWIDITNLPLFSFLIHYYNVFVQEVTDRVAVKILTNIQAELKDGTPVIDRIVRDVLQPRQQVLVEWFSIRLRMAAQKGYALHEDQIRDYVQQRINEAVDSNRELRNLEVVPVMGRIIVKQIEGAISDIVFNVVHGIIRDLGSESNKILIDDISDLLMHEDQSDGDLEQLNTQLADVLSESIGIIINRVNEAKWSDPEEALAEERIRAKVNEELGMKGVYSKPE